MTRSGLDLVLSVPASVPDPADSVVVLECAGEIQTDPIRVLSRNVAVDTFRAFDGNLQGRLRFGPGKKTDDVVMGWNRTDSSVSWSVRLNEKASFDLGINYDAPSRDSSKVADGDAGREIRHAHQGAAGIYIVKIGDTEFKRAVRQGSAVRENLGVVTLEPGTHEIVVHAKEISGEELFRLRNLTLTPANR